VRLLAPIPKPARNLFCVGKNYTNHAQEFTKSGFDADQTAADAIPTSPIVFSKMPETVIAYGDRIWDAAGVSDALDYEAELAVIIGKGGRAEPRLGLHHPQRRDRTRLAEAPQAVASRQVVRQLRPAGAGSR